MKLNLSINGMHCSSCEKIIKMELEDKVKTVKADSKKGEVFVEFDENKINEKEIKEIIKKAGYGI